MMTQQYVSQLEKPELEYYTRLKTKHIKRAIDAHDYNFAVQGYVKLAEAHDRSGHAHEVQLYLERAQLCLERARDLWARSGKTRPKSLLKFLARHAIKEKKAIAAVNIKRAIKIYEQMKEGVSKTSDMGVVALFREYVKGFELQINKVARNLMKYDSVNNLIVALAAHPSTPIVERLITSRTKPFTCRSPGR